MSNLRGLCMDCNYSLAGIDSSRCPECGRSFDPSDTTSMNMTGPISPVERMILRPSALLFPGASLAIAAITLLCLWAIPWTITGVVASLVLLALVVALSAVLYIPRRLLRSWVVRRHELPGKMAAVDHPRIRRLRILTIIAAALLVTRLPFWIFFLISLPSLLHIANYEYRDRPDGSLRPQHLWIGAFPVDSVRVDPLGVTFEISHGLTLYYRPGRKEPDLQPFFKNWYFND